MTSSPQAHTSTPFATPYRVSTITCNGSIGKNVKEVFLDTLFQHIPMVPMDSDEIGFIYMIDREGKETKGVSPRKEKRVHVKKNKEEDATKKRRFDNAISGYFQTKRGYYPSVKIFKNGTIQMTGVKKIEDGVELNKQVFKVMKDLIDCVPEIVKETVLECGEFHVRLINSDFSVPFHIRRKDLHQLLISDGYGNTSSFQPGTYPGVKLQYFWNPGMGKKDGRCYCSNKKCFGKGDGTGEGECKKVTVSIFESGKILITGAINFEQINHAYEYICKILQTHQSTLQKVVR
jgi:TATA-box binding protein (TBP) (component of TFIID and TFIIIB)